MTNDQRVVSERMRKLKSLATRSANPRYANDAAMQRSIVLELIDLAEAIEAKFWRMSSDAFNRKSTAVAKQRDRARALRRSKKPDEAHRDRIREQVRAMNSGRQEAERRSESMPARPRKKGPAPLHVIRNYDHTACVDKSHDLPDEVAFLREPQNREQKSVNGSKGKRRVARPTKGP